MVSYWTCSILEAAAGVPSTAEAAPPPNFALNALTAGRDGLSDIRQIVQFAPDHLHPGGWLLLEHGYDHASAVRELLTQRGFTQVQVRMDLASIARCSGGQWPGQNSGIIND